MSEIPPSEGVVPSAQPASRRFTRKRALKILAVVIVIEALVAIVFVPAVSSSPLMGPTFQSTYNLNQTGYLTFPDCAVVSVTWWVFSGGPAGFAVFPPEAVLLSDCHGPLPSNGSCPPAFCPPGQWELGPGPVCYESGTTGTCHFTATQAGYSIFAVKPNSTNRSTDLVQFHVSYSVPIIPFGIAKLVLVALVFAAMATTVVGAIMLRRFRRHSPPGS